MALAQSRNAQVNQFTEMLLQYLMQKNLIGERQRGEMDYLGEQMKGYQDVENLRSGNKMMGLEQEFINKTAALPEMESLRTQIRQKKMMGGDTALLERELEIESGKSVDFILNMLAGEKPLPESVQNAVKSFKSNTLQQLLATGSKVSEGKAERVLKQERMENVEIPQTKAKERQVAVAEGNLGLKKEAGGDYGKLISTKTSAILS